MQRQQGTTSLLMNGGANPSIHYVPPPAPTLPAQAPPPPPPPSYIGLVQQRGDDGGGGMARQASVASSQATPTPHGYSLRSRPHHHPTSGVVTSGASAFTVLSSLPRGGSTASSSPTDGLPPSLADAVNPYWGVPGGLFVTNGETHRAAGRGGGVDPLSHEVQAVPQDLAARVDHSTAYISALRREMRQSMRSRARGSSSNGGQGTTPALLQFARVPRATGGGGGGGGGRVEGEYWPRSRERERRDWPSGSGLSLETEVIVVDDSDDDVSRGLSPCGCLSPFLNPYCLPAVAVVAFG